MPGLRKEAEAFLTEYIDKIAPGGQNKKLYEDKFAAMSDEEFDDMIDGLEKGTVHLAAVAPNFSEVRLTMANNFAVADELGHEFFQRVWVPAKDGLPSYLTPVPYLVLDLPVRRQAQLLEKKISIPAHNNSVDDLTGQPTGASRGSKISYPETQVLASAGLKECLLELLKYRGGDERGFMAMNTMIARTGGVSLNAIEPFAGGVKSTSAVKSMLAGMQLLATL